ncbi:MAG: PPOX class F420-dependent oxidoreductase [Anaerolineae bacterium]
MWARESKTMFNDMEQEYLSSQRLGRIATVSPSGQPDVAPVSYRFDGEAFLIGGFDNTRTLKYLNVKKGQRLVAFVVDDLASTQPWTPRGIKIHGHAEIVDTPNGPVLRVTPDKKWSWGIVQPAFVDGKPVSERAQRQ